MTLDCREARLHLLDLARGRTGAATEAARAHLEGCADCRRAAAAEVVLSEVLERQLPVHPASFALKRRLAEHWPSAPARHGRWRRALVPALAAAVLLIGVSATYYQLAVVRPARAAGLLVAEAVNDHVRLLQSQHPLEVEAGGIHQVKPWFAGRLDFAPDVSFNGDADFPLRGGAVGYFLDRRAAVLVYGRRLHTISLLVFRADDLAWPARGLTHLRGVDVYPATLRGFNVLLWRRGELGYALASDVDPAELRDLAVRIAGR
jgi:anti-sigma factor RsiW